MRLKQGSSSATTRGEIAEAAARMIADGSVTSFSSAKRKAAESLGASARQLPDNLAVQRALIAYLELFEGESYHQRIVAMRRDALDALELLAEFNPRLVGPVLYGSACDHSPINLHVHCDETEALSRFLHQHKIPYRLSETSLRTRHRRYEEFPCFFVHNAAFEYEIVVLPYAMLNHPPISSLNGRPFKRADYAALSALLDLDRERVSSAAHARPMHNE